MKDVSHHHDIGLGKLAFQETAALKYNSTGESVSGDILFKGRSHFRQIETDAGDMRVGQRNLHDQISLRGSDIHGGFVLLPGKPGGDEAVGAGTDPGHGLQEDFQVFWIGVERAKEIRASSLALILLPLRSGVLP